MSRYRGPRLRIVRRLGQLPGLTQKSPSESHKAPPGQHGASAKKPSQYGVRLMEKQKLRFNYGVTEHQLINYVKKARCVPYCILSNGRGMAVQTELIMALCYCASLRPGFRH